jgi:hypothetical protein
MRTGCIPDDIAVSPHGKRDDEGRNLGEADSAFREMGAGRFRRFCGEVFRSAEYE